MKRNKITLYAAAIIVTTALASTVAMAHETTSGQNMGATQNASTNKGHKMSGGKTAKMIKIMMPTMMKHIGMSQQDMGAKNKGAKAKKQGQSMMANMKIMMPKMMQHLGMEKQKMIPGKS